MSVQGTSQRDARQWPNVAVTTQLPNVFGATIQSAGLAVGDICFITGISLIYVCTTATLGAAVWSSGITSTLVFGAGNVAATTTTRYLPTGFDGALAPTAPPQFRVSDAVAVRNLRIRQNTPAGNGNAIVYTLRVNGVASALTVSMLSTDADGSDLVNIVTLVAGDLVDISVTKALGVGTGPNDVLASITVVAV